MRNPQILYVVLAVNLVFLQSALAEENTQGIASAEANSEVKSPHTFAFNIGLYSQYIFRGLTQTRESPAIQGALDYSHASGFYAGVWASNITWLEDNNAYSESSIELDFYSGYRNTIPGTDIGFDIGFLQYVFPGERVSRNDLGSADTSELYAGLSYKWFSAKASFVVNDTAFGTKDAQGSWYAEGNVNVPFDDFGLTSDSGVALNFHIGHQEFEGAAANSPYSYTDWKLGATKTWHNGISLGVFYSDTDAKKSLYRDASGQFLGPAQIVGFIQKTF